MNAASSPASPDSFAIQSPLNNEGIQPLSHPGTVLLLALTLGCAGNFLLRGYTPGLNVLLFFALFSVSSLIAIRCARQAGWREKLVLMTPAILAISFAWRDSAALHGLALIGMVGTLALALHAQAAAALMDLTLTRYALRLFGLAAHALAGFVELVFREVRWQPSQPGLKAAVSAGVGVLLSAPLLLVFLGLFTSADAVFEAQVSRFFNWNAENVIANVLFIGAITWLTAGVLRAFARPAPAATAAQEWEAPRLLGAIELTVCLGMLNLLFLSFVLVQVRYLFGGDNLVQLTPGLTYAEYARRGFFELVAAAALVLPILLICDWLYPKESRRGAFRAVSGILIALLFVIMLSAVRRMQLYQAEYGLTELRFYVSAFMALLFALFLWFGATVLRGRRDLFASGAAGLVLLSIVALHAVNPDGQIARVNLQRLADGKEFDVAYQAGLSADAAPALAGSWARLPAPARAAFCRAFVPRLEKARDWRSWNWSRAKAATRLAEVRPAERLDQ